MDFVKSQLDRIQQQLSGLSASQKMLTGTLVVIMVMTMMWWGRYAGNAEMVPMLNQPLNDDDIARITDELSARSIAHSVSSDKKVLIPSDKRWEVLASLGYKQLLPQNTVNGFDEIIKQVNAFQPTGTTDKMFNRASEMTLSRLIGGFPNVASAVVMIDPTRVRSFDGGIQPSATISITMRPGFESSKQVVNAAATAVSSAVAGLAKERVAVVVNGVTQKHQGSKTDGTFAGGDTYIEAMQHAERALTSKVHEQLSFIRGVIVTVTVDLENKTMTEERNEVDPTKLVHKEIESKSRTDESTNTSGSNPEPGVSANTGASIAGAASGNGNNSTTSEESVKFQLQTSTSKTNIHTPAGKPTPVAAAVRVPRSYFAAIWAAKNPNGKEPADTVIDTMANDELPKIRKEVLKVTGLKNENDVSVETFFDVMPMAAMATTEAPSSAITLSLAGYTKEIAVGVLAVVSLLMMGFMVRRATPAPIVQAVHEPLIPQRLDAGEIIAGEVGEGNPMLDGLEMDPDTIKTQQMLDQVSTMVKENPDAAANLVKRWLNRS